MKIPKFKLPKKGHAIDKVKSPFTKFFITTIVCILLALTTILVMIFKTNNIYDITEDDVKEVASIHDSTTLMNIEDNGDAALAGNGTVPGITGSNSNGVGTTAGTGTGTSQNSEIDTYAYSKEAFKAFKKLGYDDHKSKDLAAVYMHFGKKYGKDAAVGMCSNIIHEGYSGDVQGGMTVANWDGKGYDLHASYKEDVWVQTKENIEAVRKKAKPGNSCGFGMIQWTWYTYIPPLCDYWTKYLPASGKLSEDDVRAAEIDYLWEYMKDSGRQKGLKGSSPYECAYNYCYNVERPANKAAQAAKRGDFAKKVAAALKKEGVY